MKTCRFCHIREIGQAENTMIRFGPRHNAHPGCYLDHKDPCSLTPAQVAHMPFGPLRDRGLMAWAREYTREYFEEP